MTKTSLFVPAIGPVLGRYWKHRESWKDHDLKWFSDKSFFKHSISLVSSYFEVNREPEYRKTIQYPEKSILISDSGGFQVASFRRRGIPCKITPVDILRWQERNADIGMNLDIPLDQYSSFGFQKCLDQSIENFQIFQDNRQNYNFKLYNVLHGRNPGEIKTWFEAARKFCFDGWAIGVKGLPYQHIYAYMWLHEHDALNLHDNCHIFGVGGLHNMISLAMLSKYFDTNLTFDSSSWAMGSRTRRFYFPNDCRFYTEFRRNSTTNLLEVPCKCPVCQNVTIQDYYIQSNGIIPLLLSLHNLYQYIEINSMINIFVQDDDAFESFIKSRNEELLIQNIQKMFESYERGGCRLVENKHKDLVNPPLKADIADKNLFRYI